MFKTSKQVKDKIKNLASKTKGNPQELLQIYMFERLLERISLSKYNENFIIKGGLLLSSILGVDLRTTRDIDTTIKGFPVTEETMLAAMEEILKVPVDDNVTFIIEKINQIREDSEYVDFRFSLLAIQDNMKIRFHIDITTGDIITPHEIEFQYPFMFSDQTIKILAYPLETVLAEKLETILRRGISNTRTRDFYDLYMLYDLKGEAIDWSNMIKAINNTSKARNSEVFIKDYKEILNVLSKDSSLKNAWEIYSRKHPYATKVSFSDTIEAIWDIMNKIEGSMNI